MEIKRIVNGRWKENCYIVSKNNNAIIIDPGGDSEHIIQYLYKKQYDVLAVINTHAHFDHIGAVSELVDEFQCPFYLHSKDGKLLRSANLYITLFAGEKPIKIPRVDFQIEKNANPLIFNDISVEVLFTPGHTDGSVCFLIENNLFTGDTLLKGKIGRVDLPGGDKQKLKTSLISISNMPRGLSIYPGHGEPSSLAQEFLSNDSLVNLLL